MREKIACLGAGRMGRGIAVVFAYAGHPVDIIDFKDRDADGFGRLVAEVRDEIASTLAMLARIGLMQDQHIDMIANRVRVVPKGEAAIALVDTSVVFEGLPEILDLKREAFAEISAMAGPEVIIASTTSTILVDDLSGSVVHPERFLNAHWLNPAFLVPLVEVSPGANTGDATTKKLIALLESVGKVPVVCAARPGYIVPRIQTLAMNEAARMVGEGVATAEDIDKAIIHGFGFRFAILGLLEFIDWGGGDILHYASRYLVGALGDERYAAPPIIAENMEAGRIGLKSGEGFYNFKDIDPEAYREKRLGDFAAALRNMGLARSPVLDG
ncbi:3-hydroxybutyryl-CoA dehydrogenase [Martelella mediterranea]|uniref:3-hydroxybutyryl-CoA dehydrogenase n=1 Tax=Martelella mediterranea TaxID=293089 RepID=UPI0022A995F9|nr:3-hydroxybutyryl-CoA dehydrogenase [Martelella mediterranea]MCD1634388.1 3-hydroxybutyryl-CoA dehydrogenase [Martelella mediterranea]